MGNFLSARGTQEEVVVTRSGASSDDPLEIVCVRGRDRCLVVIHADGSAELRRTRAAVCPQAGEAVDGSEEAAPAAPGLILQRSARGDRCVEDLRLMAPAPVVQMSEEGSPR